jgi:DNA-binding GntR family transcriptional regulator
MVKMEKSFGDLKKPQELKDWAYASIKKAVLNGEIPPGQQLHVEELAERMNISRTPIRDALIMLEHEGLINVTSRVGFFVKGITRQELEELFELRMLTEGYAAEKSAFYLTEDDLSQLDSLHQNAVAAFEKDDLMLFNQFETDLHDFLIKHSRNQRLLKMIEGLKDLTHRERLYALSSRDNVRESIQEHKKLLEALHHRDGELAGRCMRAHLENVKNRLLRILGRKVDGETNGA